MKGFKEFIMRGNLIELATAVILGAAFGKVVETFTKILLSLISKVFGGEPNFDNFMPGGVPVGPFLTALFSFIIVAAVIYFVIVKPINALNKRRGVVEEPGVTETELLTEIRDLLAKN